METKRKKKEIVMMHVVMIKEKRKLIGGLYWHMGTSPPVEV